MILLFLLSSRVAGLASGATLTVSCIDTLNVATITWSGATLPAHIKVGQASGPSDLSTYQQRRAGLPQSDFRWNRGLSGLSAGFQRRYRPVDTGCGRADSNYLDLCPWHWIGQLAIDHAHRFVGRLYAKPHLVDVKVDGFHLSVPAPKIALSIDNPFPNISNQLAPNCAVPCYFAACGVAPGADPPGTYRPCGQVRIDTSAEVPFYTVLLELLDSNGTAVFEDSQQSLSVSSVNYVRLPLYTGQSPFTLLTPGIYSLVGKMMLGTTTLATSTIQVSVQ